MSLVTLKVMLESLSGEVLGHPLSKEAGRAKKLKKCGLIFFFALFLGQFLPFQFSLRPTPPFS